MNPALSLCTHLAASPLGRFEVAPADMVEWLDGPIVAVVRCDHCAAVALAVLLDWSRSRRVRIFGLAALPADALALYRRNLERGSCDLARSSLEQQALFAATGPVQRLLVLDVASGEVVETREISDGKGLPDAAWDTRIPSTDDEAWFARVGRSKAAL